MRTVRALVVGAAALATATAGLAIAPSADAGLFGWGGQHRDGRAAVGLTTDGTSLVAFTTARPDKARWAKKVSGLSGDTALVGIDYRVQNGKLYAVGSRGGVYVIGDQAKASKVGQLSVALSGGSFGVDFNPAANALRVVSDNGQNLRQPFGTGDAPSGATVTDGGLNTAGVATTGIVAAAYTNNDLNTDTATSLFVIDATLDQVALQSPANSGSLAPTGKLGHDVGSAAGFDIFSDLKDGKTQSAKGFATFVVNGKSGLYTVDLLTGDADKVGTFRTPIADLAVSLDR